MAETKTKSAYAHPCTVFPLASRPRAKDWLETALSAVPARSITLANHHPRLRLDRRAVTRVLHLLDAHFAESKIQNPKSKISPGLSAPPGELSLVFLTDAALAQLHADFLADPTPTDVITFEGNPAFGTAGEICVSVDAALRHVAPAVPTPSARRSAPSARLPALNAAAFSAELTLYLVHGWLHLAGYDDLVPAKKRLMRRAEARAMTLLRLHDCLPSFRLS